MHSTLLIQAGDQAQCLVMLGEVPDAAFRLTERERQDLVLIGQDLGNLLDRTHLNRLAHTDALTGLPRREVGLRALERLIEDHRSRRTALGVAMADLDHFKGINDRWGHAAGDRVLAETATRMRQRLRSGDGMSRHGGEEYLLLLPETSEQGVKQVLGDLLDGIRNNPVALPGQEQERVSVTVSVGCVLCFPAECPLDTPTLTKLLLEMADRQLYRAKATGRDRFLLRVITAADCHR